MDITPLSALTPDNYLAVWIAVLALLLMGFFLGRRDLERNYDDSIWSAAH